MLNKSKFDQFSFSKATNYAKNFAGKRYSKNLEVVLTSAIRNPSLLPNLGYKNKKKIRLEEYVEKWVKSYLNAFDNRPSVRNAKKSSVVPDTLPKEILKIAIKGKINKKELLKMVKGHILLMRIENIIGGFLEEYLSVKLLKYDWYSSWGNTIDAVDFCHISGILMQVKNSDNSENSSSVRVRHGTKIIKWARRKSTEANKYFWGDLNKELGITNLSEKGFRNFINKKIKKNPNCLDMS
jgi:hypothetical protein